MISFRKVFMLAAAPCGLRGRAVMERRKRRQEWSVLRSSGKGRPAAHTNELCRGRPEDDAPRRCHRRCRWCGRCHYGSSCAQVVDAYGRVTTRC